MVIGTAQGIGQADTLVLVGYFATMLGIGAFFYRRMRRMKDFFSGGNRIPWWLSGISFYMSSFSAFTFVAYSELAYQHGFVAVTLYWTTAPAVLIGALWLAGRWRRTRIVSPVEYLEERFGLGLRQVFAWTNVPVRMIDDGLRLFAIGTFVHKALGLEMAPSIFWSGVIILAYTFMGGLWAVTVTDCVQFIVMMAGVAILVPLALSQVGGLGSLIKDSPAGFFSLTCPEHDIFYLLVIFMMVAIMYNSNFALVQRYYCVRDESDARKVGLLVAALNVLGPPIFFLPAMAARQFLPDADPTMIYANICVTLLPAGVLGLIIAAMFSATMSALSSDYNVVASVLTNDVYRRLFDPKASERRLVLVGRLTTLLIGLVTLLVALVIVAMESDTTLFSKMVKVFGVAAVPMAIPMLAGLLWPGCTNRGAIAGFLAGVAVGLFLFFRGAGEHTIILATVVTTLVFMIGGSWLLPASKAEINRRIGFLDRMKEPVRPAPDEEVSVEEAFSPFRVVGYATACIGAVMLLALVMVENRVAFRVDLVVGAALTGVGLMMARPWRGSPRLPTDRPEE